MKSKETEWWKCGVRKAALKELVPLHLNREQLFSSAHCSLRLLYVSCGEDDPRINGQRNLEWTRSGGEVKVEFSETADGHEWKV